MLIREINKRHVEVKLYGNIGGWFANGDVFTDMIADFESKYDIMTIREHCYGGSVFEGNVMYNALLNTSLKVNIIIDGIAASMGCFVLPSVENVSIADNGFGMVHRPKGGGQGDADDLENSAKLLRDMENNFIKRVNERTGMAEDEIKAKWFDGKDHWLNAQEMVQFGFAKRVIPATAKNIKQLDAQVLSGMAMDNIYDRYAAVLTTPKSDINNSTKNGEMNNQLLITAFGLKGVTAESSDTAILAALQDKNKENEDRIAQLEGEAKAKLETTIKVMLDTAQTEGKFMPEARAAYETIGKTSGAEVLATVLAGMGKKTVIAQAIVPQGKGEAGAGTAQNWEWYQQNNPRALEQMQKENPDQFKELYKAEFGNYPA
jgi:Protease subunit of ATP-dependent Clp proteases